MAEQFYPEREDQVVELVQWALSAKRRVAVQGLGSKAGFGYACEADDTISTAHLSGILAYEPAELVMKALPGTPLLEIEQALAAHQQHLAFEPILLGRLYNGGQAHHGTIGGVFMGNLSGPRRFKAGAARDHILGIKAVSGRGEPYKSGGMVIKNVTGYDMSKLLTGSWGTLSILTELSFKVVPAPRYWATVTVSGQPTAAALQLMTELAQSPYEISGLAHLPQAIAESGQSLTCIRLEGSKLSVDERVDAVKKRLPAGLEAGLLDGEAAAVLWRTIRDVSVFAGELASKVLIKLSIPVTSAIDIIAILEEPPGSLWYLDAAGGWVWALLDEGDAVAKIAQLRSALLGYGGSLVIHAATDEIKTSAGVNSPLSPALAGLTKRVKQSFDPENILNPGRLYRM